MKNQHHAPNRPKHAPQSAVHEPAHRGFLRRWFLANSAIAGVLAMIWLLLRSGSKPSRLAYPCQQAAISAATLAFGAPVVAALIAARQRLLAGVRTPAGVVVIIAGLCLAVGYWGYWSQADEYTGPRLDPPPNYRAQLYHVSECPEDPIGSRFVGVDNLLNLMGRGGLKLHRSTTESLISGPTGLIAADDVVVIKINYQWPERGGTNTDVLRGLILRILEHPDGFAGQVVVCENAQFNPIDGFDRPYNNAQDVGLSPHDVVVAMSAQRQRVS
ncbi:MAG: hypothetical protein GY778_29380, partial [bacterium]|nr:hypothetical protein [bacterium]